MVLSDKALTLLPTVEQAWRLALRTRLRGKHAPCTWF